MLIKYEIIGIDNSRLSYTGGGVEIDMLCFLPYPLSDPTSKWSASVQDWSLDPPLIMLAV